MSNSDKEPTHIPPYSLMGTPAGLIKKLTGDDVVLAARAWYLFKTRMDYTEPMAIKCVGWAFRERELGTKIKEFSRGLLCDGPNDDVSSEMKPPIETVRYEDGREEADCMFLKNDRCFILATLGLGGEELPCRYSKLSLPPAQPVQNP